MTRPLLTAVLTYASVSFFLIPGDADAGHRRRNRCCAYVAQPAFNNCGYSAPVMQPVQNNCCTPGVNGAWEAPGSPQNYGPTPTYGQPNQLNTAPPPPAESAPTPAT